MGNEFDTTTESTTFRILSAAKGAALLVRVQSNPEISTNNQTFVGNLVDRAAAFIIEYCQLLRYPELIEGYSIGTSSASANLTALDTNELFISVNGSGFVAINPTLANCDSGANTAAELQTQIRAEDTDGFDEVTVAWDSDNTRYTITSGRFGMNSAINVAFNEAEKHVLQALKMNAVYGGEEFLGGVLDKELDDALVMLVEAMYVRMGVEGLDAGGTIGKVNFTVQGLDSLVARILGRRRRLVKKW